ncbi:MAG TPA: hypothetical protein VFW07_10120 [Parafilimonas sp.]|nr:hypothetical protein [Parafilimonas sp.]
MVGVEAYISYRSILNEYGQVLPATGHHPDSSLKMTFKNNFDIIYYVGGESKGSVGKVTYSSTIKPDDKEILWRRMKRT